MSLMRNSDWRSLRSEMDRMFEDMFGSSGSQLAQRGQGGGNFWAPAVDVSENQDNFLVNVELPGIKPENVDIELQDNVLTLKGERKLERRDEKENFHFVERSYGSFYRSFTLPRNVDPNGINANFEDGLLRITIPKAEEAKPRKVAIGAGKQVEAKGKTMQAGASQ